SSSMAPAPLRSPTAPPVGRAAPRAPSRELRSTASWKPAGTMSSPRYFPAAAVLSDGKVLLVGGHDGVQVVASAEVFDPAGGTWSLTGSISTARNALAAVMLQNGNVLAAGGFTSSAPSAAAELFDPQRGAWSATGSLA